MKSAAADDPMADGGFGCCDERLITHEPRDADEQDAVVVVVRDKA